MDNKIIAISALSASLLGLGIYSYSSRKVIDIQKVTLNEKDKIIEELTIKFNQQQVVKVNTVTREKVTTRKPDGTVIASETTVEDKTSEETKTMVEKVAEVRQDREVTKSEEVTHSVEPSQTKYSLFVNYPTTFKKDYSLTHIGFGMRLATTPFWFQIEGGLDHEFKLGVRVDF